MRKLENCMEKWQAHYKDAHHDLDCEILNYGSGEYKHNTFKLCIDGVTFEGSDLDDWEIDADTYEADREKIDSRFSIFKYGNKDEGYYYMLQRYSLSFKIPVVMFSIERQRKETGELEISYSSVEDTSPGGPYYVLDEEKVNPDNMVYMVYARAAFALHINGECFKVKNVDVFFDNALEAICHQIKGRYYICNCYGCMYSDYSPYGCNNIGTMACFVDNAEKYLRVNGKYKQYLKEGECTIWELFDDKKYVQRQETELCEKFKPRIGGLGGYRGQIYK